MPTSSIPAMPNDTVPAIATAATNFISSVSGPLEVLMGIALAFLLIEIIVARLTPEDHTAPVDHSDDFDW